MNPALVQVAKSLVQAGLMFLLGYLVRKGMMSQDDADKVLVELMSILVPIVIALAIAAYGAFQAKFQQKLLITAQAMPQGVTTKEVIAAAKTTSAPSFTTQRDQSPKPVPRSAGKEAE